MVADGTVFENTQTATVHIEHALSNSGKRLRGVPREFTCRRDISFMLLECIHFRKLSCISERDVGQILFKYMNVKQKREKWLSGGWGGRSWVLLVVKELTENYLFLSVSIREKLWDEDL